MNQEIILKLKAQKKYLHDTYSVTRLGLFGSFSRGEETSDSDVDILIEFRDVPGMKEFFSTEEYLEGILNRKIDLVRENAIRPELKERIMSELILI